MTTLSVNAILNFSLSEYIHARNCAVAHPDRDIYQTVYNRYVETIRQMTQEEWAEILYQDRESRIERYASDLGERVSDEASGDLTTMRKIIKALFL
ncbi:MAG: hypothetical protein QXL94_00220 [Candidatus Parvarchaeum sp.]